MAAPPVGPDCLQCAIERRARRNYCGACGNMLRPRCERKQVTVLFVDVSGFTTLSERLDAGQVSEIMQRLFDLIRNAVHENDGTVNQLPGEGVMALFGEASSEHHACRALRTALAVQERLEVVRGEMRRSYGLAFRVRMGINTGPVVVGTIGAALRTDYTATGTTGATALGLLKIAEPDQIVLTDRTREVAAGRYGFAEVGAMPLTESGETVVVYELTCERVEHAETRSLVAVDSTARRLHVNQPESTASRERAPST
jgi:class 3 adenylate cyclase